MQHNLMNVKVKDVVERNSSNGPFYIIKAIYSAYKNGEYENMWVEFLCFYKSVQKTAANLEKDSMVGITFTIEPKKSTDPQDKYKFVFIADSITYLSPKTKPTVPENSYCTPVEPTEKSEKTFDEILEEKYNSVESEFKEKMTDSSFLPSTKNKEVLKNDDDDLPF
jgi:single-stranded DNA-binding protein